MMKHYRYPVLIIPLLIISLYVLDSSLVFISTLLSLSLIYVWAKELVNVRVSALFLLVHFLIEQIIDYIITDKLFHSELSSFIVHSLTFASYLIIDIVLVWLLFKRWNLSLDGQSVFKITSFTLSQPAGTNRSLILLAAVSAVSTALALGESIVTYNPMFLSELESDLFSSSFNSIRTSIHTLIVTSLILSLFLWQRKVHKSKLLQQDMA